MLGLALLLGACASPGFGTRETLTRAEQDRFLTGATKAKQTGIRDPKSPDIRAPARASNLPAGASESVRPLGAAKAPSESLAKRGKPCKPRAHAWQVWRPKVCP